MPIPVRLSVRLALARNENSPYRIESRARDGRPPPVLELVIREVTERFRMELGGLGMGSSTHERVSVCVVLGKGKRLWMIFYCYYFWVWRDASSECWQRESKGEEGMGCGCGGRGGGTIRIRKLFLRCAFALAGDGLTLLPERVVEFQEAVQPPDPSIVRHPLPVRTSACAHQARHAAHPPRPPVPSPNSLPLPFPTPLPPNTLPPYNHDSPPLQPPLHLNAIHPNHNPPAPILLRKLNMHAHIAWQHKRPER